MPDDVNLSPLTGDEEFNRLIAEYSMTPEEHKRVELRDAIWDRYGTEGTVFISDMASFSSTSRKLGVLHFLKLIYRARQAIAPAITDNGGLLLKCDADNCYAFFERPGDAIRASFDVNAALYRLNDSVDMTEQIYLSVGIDHGDVLLIDDSEFYGDPVNTASKLGEDLAVRAETLVTERALSHASFVVPESAERMVARISEIEIRYVRMPMTEALLAAAE